MATLASLNIALTADSAKLKKDLDKAKGTTNKWAKDQKKQLTSVASSMKMIGVAAAAIGFGSLIKGSVQASKELSNMSNLTGMTTTELQRVTPSLDRAGISVEKYADIIKDVNDKTHDFLQTGGGPMKDFFEKIAPKVGITADAFKNLSGKEGLQLYIDSLQKAGLSQEQMTFYMEALASDSTMLLPLLVDNAAGMNEFALATNEVLKPETVMALQDLGTGFATLAGTLKAEVLNALEPFVSAINSMIENNPVLISGLMTLAGTITVAAVALAGFTAGVWLLNAAMALNPIVLAFTAISAAVFLGVSAWKQLNSVVSQTAPILATVASAISEELRWVNAINTAMAGGITMSRNTAEVKLIQARASLANADAMRLESIELIKQGKEYTRLGEQMVAAREDMAEAQADLFDIFNGGLASDAADLLARGPAKLVAEYAKEIRDADAAQKDLVATAGELSPEYVTATETVDALEKALESATGDVITLRGNVVTVADAADTITFDGAIKEAQTLAEKLGISLELAKAIAKIGGSAGASGPDAAIQQTRDAYNMNDLISNGVASVTNYPSSRSSPGGGRDTSKADAAKAMRAATQAILDEAAKADAAGWGSIADEFADTLKSELSNALATGDWSTIGDTLMNQLTMSIIDKTVGSAVDFGMSLLGFADGGIVPSTPNSKSYADSVPAILQPGELVVPVDQVDNFLGGGSGGGQTFNINVTGDVSRLTRSEIVKMMPEIAAGTNMLNKENGRR